VSATLSPATDDSEADTVLFTFDESVQIDPDGTLFWVYGVEGVAVEGVTAERNTSNNAQVLVTFADGDAVDNAVGVSVSPGAVAAATGLTEANVQDEAGVTNSQTNAITPGKTTGPEMTSVTMAAETDDFDNVVGYTAIVTFDEDISDVTDPVFYLADGQEVTADDVTVEDETPNTATIELVGDTVAEEGDVVLVTYSQNAVNPADTGTTSPPGAMVIAAS
jgi:hypothetical protein